MVRYKLLTHAYEYNISETAPPNDSSVSPPVVTNIHTNGNTILYDKTPESIRYS